MCDQFTATFYDSGLCNLRIRLTLSTASVFIWRRVVDGAPCFQLKCCSINSRISPARVQADLLDKRMFSG